MSQDASIMNSKKLDRITQLLEGDGEDAPGLLARVRNIEVLLLGKDGTDGMVHKLTVVWRIHVWLLCTMSAGVGFGIREAIRIIWKV